MCRTRFWGTRQYLRSLMIWSTSSEMIGMRSIKKLREPQLWQNTTRLSTAWIPSTGTNRHSPPFKFVTIKLKKKKRSALLTTTSKGTMQGFSTWTSHWFRSKKKGRRKSTCCLSSVILLAWLTKCDQISASWRKSPRLQNHMQMIDLKAARNWHESSTMRKSRKSWIDLESRSTAILLFWRLSNLIRDPSVWETTPISTLRTLQILTDRYRGRCWINLS